MLLQVGHGRDIEIELAGPRVATLDGFSEPPRPEPQRASSGDFRWCVYGLRAMFVTPIEKRLHLLPISCSRSMLKAAVRPLIAASKGSCE